MSLILKHYPGLHSANDLICNEYNELQNHPACQLPDGRWVAARPLSFYGGFFRRVKLAWKVFVGHYDALKWEGQERI
jgi:hypothetical protein